jgi:hypothetical protein
MGNPHTRKGMYSWLLLAARLAALGDGSFLKNWQENASCLSVTFAQFVDDLCNYAAFELASAREGYAWMSVIRIVDMNCFLVLERSRLQGPVIDTLENIVNELRGVSLSDDDIQCLRQWRAQYPLPEEFIPAMDFAMAGT